MNPKGKTAIVTGGAHRVGKGIVLGLAQAGANVVINYNSSAASAEETANQSREFDVGALAIQANITDQYQVEALVAAANKEFGRVDILVNNASLWKKTPFPTGNTDDWHLVTNILINGAFYCSNAVAPLMLAQGDGVIINIIDLAAYEPWPEYIAHCVGKSALLAMTRQLALELAPAVRVNAIAPGPTLPPPDFDDEQIAGAAQKTLLDRWGSSQDIAGAVLFLVKANYVTAETLAVDGGQRFGHRKREHG